MKVLYIQFVFLQISLSICTVLSGVLLLLAKEERKIVGNEDQKVQNKRASGESSE
jgi:hypothetical protein